MPVDRQVFLPWAASSGLAHCLGKGGVTAVVDQEAGVLEALRPPASCLADGAEDEQVVGEAVGGLPAGQGYLGPGPVAVPLSLGVL